MKIRLLTIGFLVVFISMFSFAQQPTELLVNGGFEQEKSLYPWVVETSKGGVSVSGPNENGNPHGGNRFVTLGGTNKESDAIEQTVIIPQNLSSLALSFALKIKSTGNDKIPHDYFRVYLVGEGFNSLLIEYNNTTPCDWQTVSLNNLANYSGYLATIRFEAVTDGTKPTKFSLDDVSFIYTIGSGNPTPNLEFLSPYHGCVYPSATIGGSTPFSIIAYAPNGVQSLSAYLDDELIATTTETRLDTTVNWSNLTAGEHVLTAELIDPIDGIRIRRCQISSSNILEGADFENGGSTAWVGANGDGSESLIRDVGLDLAYDGSGVALIGTTMNSAETLEHIVGIPDDAQDTLTLSFLYKTPLASSIVKDNLLYVHLIDVETNQDFLVATVYPQPGGEWVLNRTLLSMAELGLIAGRDYILRFQANTASGTSFSSFYVDDVALYVYSQTLAAGTPVRDEEGDVPGQNTPGRSITDISVHKDPPNTCSCGHSSHQQMVITTSGFSNLTMGNVKVKFKFDDAPTSVSAQIVSINGNSITCTIPDASDKNKMAPARIKVKTISPVQKAFSKDQDQPAYSCSNTGVETGFYYGFPEKIQNVQLLSSSSVSALGGTSQSFSVNATGLVTFKQKKNGVCQTAAGFITNPVIFAADGSEGRVRVKHNALTNTCSSSNWTSYWTGDGAPTVCRDPYRCIQCNSMVELRLLNPDNVVYDTNSWPSKKWDWYMGTQSPAVKFIPPSSTPSFTSTAGKANSVGYVIQGGVKRNIAIRPLSSASNYVTFTGTNLYRITDISLDTGYSFDGLSGTGWDDTTGKYGKSFTAWAPAHAPGLVTPAVFTKENSYSAAPLTYVASITTSPVGSAPPSSNTSSCLYSSTTHCPAQWTDYVTPQTIPFDHFVIGPGEPDANCTATCIGGDCAHITATPIYQTYQIADDDLGRKQVDVALNINRQATGSGDQSAVFHVTPTSTYGAVETVDLTIYFTGNGGNQLSVSITATPTIGASAPLTVAFSAFATGGNGSYTYSWTFGDGALGNGSAINHTYQTNGTFIAEVKVTDTQGFSGSTTQVITVGTPLDVTASASPISGKVPLTVNFNASVSGGTPNYTYSWNFGDGQTGTGQTPAHTYTSAGNYTAKLTVTDSVNTTGSSSVNITVNPVTPLTVAATASPTSGTAPLTVNFSASASGGTSGYTYSWNFGDGVTLTGQSVSHVYSTAGSYTATVTAKDSSNSTSTASVGIAVSSGSSLVISASATPTTATKAPLTTTFTCTASGGTQPYSYLWTFGDGATSISANTTHTYTTTGLWTATIDVVDATNIVVSKSFSIKVGAIVNQ